MRMTLGTLPSTAIYFFTAAFISAAPLRADEISKDAMKNEALNLSFDLVISSSNPKSPLAVAHSLSPTNSLQICLASGGPDFAKETFDYLGCRQGFDLESGKSIDGPLGDLYLDGMVDPYITSPILVAPNGIKVLPGRRVVEVRSAEGNNLKESVAYLPSSYRVGQTTFIVRSNRGHLFKVSLDDNTPNATLAKGVYPVIGLTFHYMKARPDGTFP